MKNRIGTVLLAAIMVVLTPVVSAWAQDQGQAQAAGNQIEALEVAEQGGSLFVRLTLREALAAPPASFSVANPARIAFDFPATANALGRNVQTIEQGDLRSANIVQAGDRTRLVLNLVKMTPYDTRVDGRSVIISLTPISAQATPTPGAQAYANFAEAKPTLSAGESIRDINFRRGKEGEGRVVVQLSSAQTGIDIRQQGGNLVVDFLKTSLPEHLRRKSDVTDFATPVTGMVAQQLGENVRLVVTPNGLWEHNAYQSDDQFVLVVKRVADDPNKLIQGSKAGYSGQKFNMVFQDVSIRQALNAIGSFAEEQLGESVNLIMSDSVQGNLTLKLTDVPWDQALDLVLDLKNLGMIKSGNVIRIAPRAEIALQQAEKNEAQNKLEDTEPLSTESFQINYHKASLVADLLTSSSGKDQKGFLSARGKVALDDRNNKLFVTDVSGRLERLRRLVDEIDVPPRQVLIEARIVEANKDFARDLGVRLGYGDNTVKNLGDGAQIGFGSSVLGGTTNTFNPGLVSSGGLVPAATFAALNLSLFNRSATRFLNLELSALESDQRGRVISSPRVLTANQVEASIEQGTEIPYQEATSSGATSVSFKKAVLSLKVKPQITPDGRIQLQVLVNKDSPIFDPRFSVPSINTKNLKSEVLVENGGTVVIGGIYEEEQSTSVARVPVLGEIPVLGALFRTTKTINDRSELLVFITPRIVADSLTLK